MRILFWRRKQRGLISTVIRLLLFIVVIWAALTLAVLFLFKYVNPPVWSWRVFHYFSPPAPITTDIESRWVPLEQIPKSLQLAVIASEDQRFPLHHGLDMTEIGNALQTAAGGGHLRGASTLTQQTAKNLFLWPGRDWVRKGVEMPLALMMDAVWGKKRVLEVYLNIVEFGPGVYGADAASRYWFKQPLRQLNVVQAAELAAVLPDPWRFRAFPPGRYVASRQQWILQQMDHLGYGWLDFDNIPQRSTK